MVSELSAMLVDLIDKLWAITGLLRMMRQRLATNMTILCIDTQKAHLFCCLQHLYYHMKFMSDMQMLGLERPLPRTSVPGKTTSSSWMKHKHLMRLGSLLE